MYISNVIYDKALMINMKAKNKHIMVNIYAIAIHMIYLKLFNFIMISDMYQPTLMIILYINFIYLKIIYSLEISNH
jgi:hypothetical protein